MIPVGQQGGDENIGHTGQVGRLGQHFMMVEDPVEKQCLAIKQQKSEDRIQDIDMMEYGDEGIQDQPVQIIVVRVQYGGYGVQEQVEFKHQCIDEQYESVSRTFLSEDTDHQVGGVTI